MRSCLLKLSGEALGGGAGAGLDGAVLGRIADEIASAVEPGLGIGIVAGAGNFVCGAALEAAGIPRQRGDFMGMIATVLLFAGARRLGPRVNRVLVGVSALALAAFGLWQLWLGVGSPGGR